VWHTRTVQVPMAMLQPPTLIIDDTSISGLLHALDENKLASFSTSRGITFMLIIDYWNVVSSFNFDSSNRKTQFCALSDRCLILITFAWRRNSTSQKLYKTSCVYSVPLEKIRLETTRLSTSEKLMGMLCVTPSENFLWKTIASSSFVGFFLQEKRKRITVCPLYTHLWIPPVIVYKKKNNNQSFFYCNSIFLMA
jgi:hypothetical protein